MYDYDEACPISMAAPGYLRGVRRWFGISSFASDNSCFAAADK
jgi:hypothetical protein